MTGQTTATPTPDTSRRPARSRRMFMVLVPLLAALLAFGAAEGLLRVFVKKSLESEKPAERPALLRSLPGSGRVYGLIPGLPPPAGTNSLGFRGAEVAAEKPVGTFRIAMLGDSITYGNGVAAGETFSARLEELLNAGPGGRRFEVLNLGVSGYNSAQEAAALEELGLPLAPDLVVLNVCLNDSDPVKQLLGISLVNKTQVGGWRDINLRTVVESSYLLTLLKHKMIAVLQNFGDTLTTLNSPRLFLDNRVDEGAWADMKVDMARIVAMARERGIPVAVVIYPYKSQLPLPPEERVPQQDLLRHFDGLGVPALDAAPVYQASTLDMFNDAYIHLSVHGHREIARGIAAFLGDRGLLPVPAGATP